MALDSAWLDEEARLPEDPRASLGRVIRILLYRKWRFLLVCAPILLGGLGYLLIVPDRYAAHGTVMVGFQQPELLTAEQARDPIRGEPDIDGAIALVRAYRTLPACRGELNLVALPEFAARPAAEPAVDESIAPIARRRSSDGWALASGESSIPQSRRRDRRAGCERSSRLSASGARRCSTSPIRRLTRPLPST